MGLKNCTIFFLSLTLIAYSCAKSRESREREGEKIEERKTENLCGFLYGLVLPTPNALYPHIEQFDKKIEILAHDLKELGVNAIRVPTEGLIQTFPEKLTVGDITDEKIESYILKMNDEAPKIKKMLEYLKSQIDDLVVIGVASIGYTGSLPCYGVENCPFKIEFVIENEKLPKRYLPDLVSNENYLGWAYLNARALTRFFGKLIDIWQVENEVNVTCETLVFGWRHGRSWCDRKFIKKLAGTIYKAIKDESPQKMTTINLHTDYKNHIDISGDGKWVTGYLDVDLEDFWDYMDVVGFDFYPNYEGVINRRLTDPKRAELVLERIALIKNFMVNKGKTKPIIIIETGYPSGPTELGFDEEKQAEFVRKIFQLTKDNINGTLIFTFYSSEKVEPNRPSYQSIESFWGFYRENGERKKVFYEYKEVDKSDKGTMCK